MSGTRRLRSSVALGLASAMVGWLLLPAGFAQAESLGPSYNVPVIGAPAVPTEVLALRTEFSQTFANPNGSFTAEITPLPRFYRDEHNAWQDISLSVVPATDRPGFLENTTNTVQSYFPMDFGGGTPLTVASGSTSVSFTPVLPSGVSSVVAAVYGLGGAAAPSVTGATYAAAVTDAVYIASATVAGSSVLYNGLFTSTDVGYSVIPGGVQESVTLRSPSAPASYAWTVQPAGLSAVQQGNSLLFRDGSGNDVLYMPPPTMTDAAGHSSSAVAVSLQGHVLTITPDPAFLATAKFPVVVNPTLEAAATSGYDTFLSQSNPNTNYHGNAYDEVGNTAAYGVARSLIMFPAPPVLDPGAYGASITSATLSMYQDNSSENGDPIGAYAITGSWSAGTATWNNQPTHSATADDTESQATSNIVQAPYVGTWNFNVTPSVRTFYSSTAANYGWMLIDSNEGNGSNYAEFYSLHNSHTSLLPVLSITYNVNPVGSEPFWMQDRNGVNPMNGNLTLSGTDLSTPGQGGGFAVQRTFNSLLTASLPSHPNLFGPGFTSNLDMSVAAAGGHSPVVFTDANGLQHVFVPTGFSGPPYQGAVGEHLTLTKGSGPVYWTVQEQNGTTYDFNQTGQLMDIKTHGTGGTWETTTLQRNGAGQLTGVTDPSGRTWSVTLNTNGTVATVTDPAGRYATYTYNSSGELTTVTVTGHTTSDSTDTTTTTVAQYGYNASGQLASYTNPNGDATDYAYGSTGAISSVSYSYTESSGGTPQNATYDYSYGTVSNPGGSGTAASFSATVTDPNSNVVEYETNEQGNVVQYIQDPGSSPHLNLVTQYTWDPHEQLDQVTFPNGQTQSMGYDTGGNGLPTSLVNGNGNTSLQSYTPLANPSTQNGLDGAVSGMRYNQNTPTDSYDPLGNDTMVNADANGQVTSASAPVGLGDNLVPNSSFELTDSSPTGVLEWDTYGGTAPGLVTSPVPPFGTHSVQVTAGSFIQMSSYLPVTPGGGYNLSDWVESGSLSPNGSGYGAVVNVFWFKDSTGTPSGTPEAADLSNLAGPTPWVQQATEVAAPRDANYAQVQLQVAGTGTVSYDGLSLTPVAGQPNLLLNSSFLDTVPGTHEPDNWTLSGLTTSDVLDTTTTHAGFISEKVTGASGTTKNLSESLPLPSYQVGGYVLSGWSEQSGATAPGGSVLYDLRFEAVYADGTVVDKTASFAATSGWQYVSLNVDPGHTDSNGYALTALRVYIDYSDETGTAWFADPQLQALPAKSTATVFNLVQNPGFEENTGNGTLPDFWQNASGSGAGTAAWSSAAAYTGSYSVAVTPATPGSGASTTVVSSSTIQLPGTVIPLTLVGYIHTVGLAGDTAYLQVVVEDSSGHVLGTWATTKLGSTTAVDGQVPWTRVSVSVPASSFSATDPPASAVVSLCQDPDSGGSAAASYFDDVRLSQQDLFSHYAYNAQDNYVTSATDPLGNMTTLTPDANTGDVAGVTDPNGNQTSFTYDKFDRVLSTTVPYQAQIGGTVQGETFAYSYDAMGHLLSVTAPNNAQDGYTYNELNQLLTSTETVSGTAQTTKRSYDVGGRLGGVSYPNGNSETLGYDVANRLTGTSSTGTWGTQAYGYGYDGNSNLTSISAGGSTTASFGYDNANRLTSVSEPAGSVTDTQSFTLDSQGNPTSVAFSLNNSLATQWTLAGTWTLGNELSQASTGPANTYFEYADTGQLLKVYDGVTGAAVQYTYDPAHRVAQAVAHDGSGTEVLNETLGYDAAGNLTSLTDNLAGATYDFTYDTQNQLVQEQAPNGHTYTYIYDALGNRTSVVNSYNGTKTTTTYGYDTEGNRLTSVGSASLTYDAMGNLLSDGTNTYTWNSANQLVSVKYGTTTETYAYDALGRRISKNGYGIHYYGLSTEIAYVTSPGNAFVKSFTYNGQGLPQTMTMATSAGNLTYTYVYDGLGNLVGLVDDNATINGSSNANYGKEVVTYTYDAWGDVLGQTDTSGYNAANINPFRYKGYFYDSGTGLYYINARFFNPAWGRFISSDPLAMSAGALTNLPAALNTVGGLTGTVPSRPSCGCGHGGVDAASDTTVASTANAYAYAQNNPFAFTDPTGMNNYWVIGVVTLACLVFSSVVWVVPVVGEGVEYVVVHFCLVWGFVTVWRDIFG